MAVETSSERIRTSDSSSNESAQQLQAGLLPGERVVAELDTGDDGNFKLTNARVVFRGGSETDAVYASAHLKDITSIQISRRPRARRSAAWGIVGLSAAIGVWQVTPNSSIGITAAVAVAVISLVLMADYWIRPAGVHLEFHTSGGSFIGGEVGGKSAIAMKFTHDVEDAKRRLVPGRLHSPYRNYPSS
ncbi:hypothetical protein JYU04_01815 [Dehalococcoides mccartyi]|nr:hypothetical protein [Dehalococcoides mccartyi]